jgi:hypothetical protein
MEIKRPSWGIIIFVALFTLGPIFKFFTGTSYNIKLEANRSGYELADYGLIPKNLEKEYDFISSVDKIDFEFYVRNEGIYASSFQKIALRELLFSLFLPLCMIIGYSSDWLVQLKKLNTARLILHIGIIFSVLAFIFVVIIYPVFLEKLVFFEIFQSRPYLTGSPQSEYVLRFSAAIIFFCFFIYSDRQVQKAQNDSLKPGASNA